MKNKIYTGIVVALFVILAVFLVLIAVTTVRELTGDESAAESEASENPWDTPDFSDPETSKETSVPDNTDISDPEVSTPETSTPEVSEPELSKEDILDIFDEKVDLLKEVLKDGYRVFFSTGDTITHHSDDLSTLAEYWDTSYIYKDGNFAATYSPYNITIEIKNSEYTDILPYIENQLNKTDADIRFVLDTIHGENIKITYDKKTAEFFFSGDCEYDGKDATVSGYAEFVDSSVDLKATYTYEKYNQNTGETSYEHATIKYVIAKAGPPFQYDVQPDRSFENQAELSNYISETRKVAHALPKLMRHPLNKLITVTSDNKGMRGTEKLKLLTVGTNEDFVAAFSTLYDKSYGQFFYRKENAYVTDSGYDQYSESSYWVLDGDDEWIESTDGHDSKEKAYTVESYFEHKNFFNLQDLFYSADDDTTPELQRAFRNLHKFESINYTDNGDGTITATITLSKEDLSVALFGVMDNFNTWSYIISQDKDLEQALCITYDNETGVLVGMTFDVYAEGKNNAWYKHSFELTVTDADKSMLPEKEELLAGNWN